MKEEGEEERLNQGQILGHCTLHIFRYLLYLSLYFSDDFSL